MTEKPQDFTLSLKVKDGVVTQIDNADFDLLTRNARSANKVAASRALRAAREREMLRQAGDLPALIAALADVKRARDLSIVERLAAM